MPANIPKYNNIQMPGTLHVNATAPGSLYEIKERICIMASGEDKKKEKRALSKAEQSRLDRFQSIVKELETQGYMRHDLTISIKKANVFAILLLIPLCIIGYGAYYLVNRSFDFGGSNIWLFLAAFVVLVVVHELIHGLFWSIFTPHHFKDIEFGIMRPSYNPYCTCLVPLEKNTILDRNRYASYPPRGFANDRRNRDQKHGCSVFGDPYG